MNLTLYLTWIVLCWRHCSHFNCNIRYMKENKYVLDPSPEWLIVGTLVNPNE